MANPIAKEMAVEYGIGTKKGSFYFDTFSCILGVIPYGAQMLVAISAANELEVRFLLFQVMPRLYYPMFLLTQFSDCYCWCKGTQTSLQKNKVIKKEEA